VTVIRADTRALPLADASVDLIVTIRERLADVIARTLATKPFELTPSADLERLVDLAMADAAIGAFAAWLRDEAADLRRAEPNATGSIRNHLVAGADRLQILADAIDPQPERTVT